MRVIETFTAEEIGIAERSEALILIPHNDCPSPTLTACAPGMLPHACVFASCRLLYSASETSMRRKIMLVVRTLTAHFGPDSNFPPSTERQLTIEYP